VKILTSFWNSFISYSFSPCLFKANIFMNTFSSLFLSIAMKHNAPDPPEALPKEPLGLQKEQERKKTHQCPSLSYNHQSSNWTKICQSCPMGWYFSLHLSLYQRFPTLYLPVNPATIFAFQCFFVFSPHVSQRHRDKDKMSYRIPRENKCKCNKHTMRNISQLIR